jgi:CheY-like chemotaxis protein
MRSKRILVIDDEERIREVVRACLEDLGGWDVEIGNSGADGLHKITTESFDALILDISMPDMDGFAFLKQLLERKIYPAIPAILLTAKMFSNDAARFADLGVVGIINKPFNPLTISKEVATILNWN